MSKKENENQVNASAVTRRKRPFLVGYREILRLRSEGKYQRQIAKICGYGKGTVQRTIAHAAEHGLEWPLPPEMTDEWLRVLFSASRAIRPQKSAAAPVIERAKPPIKEDNAVPIEIYHTKERPPKIHMFLGKRFIINKIALKQIGNPQNLVFWWNERENMLLISGNDEKTPQSYEVKKCYYENKITLKIQTKSLISAIMSLTGWGANAVYNVFGEYIPELNMLCFRMSDVIVEEAKPNEEVR